jgi:hypothetical protein
MCKRAPLVSTGQPTVPHKYQRAARQSYWFATIYVAAVALAAVVIYMDVSIWRP